VDAPIGVEPVLTREQLKALERPVDRRQQQPVGQVGDRPDRRHQPHAREVERAGHHRHRVDGQRAVAGHRQQRHDPAQAPADELHRGAAVVLRDAADGRRQDVVDPVLEAELAVAEADLAVLEQVGRVAEREQVLGQRAAAAQVEAQRRRGERRDEEDRELARQRVVAHQVAVDGALRLLLDDRRGRAPQVGQAAAEHLVEHVGRRVGELVGLGDGEGEVHGSRCDNDDIAGILRFRPLFDRFRTNGAAGTPS